MPEGQPTTEPVTSVFNKKPKSKVEALKNVARQFFAFLQEHGGVESYAARLADMFHEDGEAVSAQVSAELETTVFEGMGQQPPEGWKAWDFTCLTLEDQPVMQVKAVRTSAAVLERGMDDGVPRPKKEPKPAKEKKAKKEKEAKDMRSVFTKKLAELDVNTLIRPWMAKVSLRLVETPEELQAWVRRIQSDFSLWKDTPAGSKMPVIAVDTETFGTISATGLDTRLVNGRPQIDCAGICLCADGIESLYLPISHEEGPNLDRVAVRRILQPLFDTSYLVFFNAKFDREVLRLTMGLTFRDYPFYEDVQVDNYLLDPKADLDEEVADMGGQGLKDLAERDLGITQIDIWELCGVKAQYFNPTTKKRTTRVLLAPFSWVPPRIAVLYAAADSLTTWLLWDMKHTTAQKMKFPFKLDHQLIDSLTWIERQRFIIDIPRLQETVKLHHRKMTQFSKRLADLAGDPDFNPGSPAQLADVLFNTLGFKKGKVSVKTGAASTDKTVLEDLKKENPNHPFLIALSRYRSYASLHPSHLEYDPRDLSARLFFKQCTVAGGRLAAQGGGKKEHSKGGKGKDDGGFGLNPQAIKGVKGNKWASGRAILFPTPLLEDNFEPEWLDPIPMESLHESILKKIDDKLKIEAPDVVNGVAQYMGRWWSFRPEDTLSIKTSLEAQNEWGLMETYSLAVDPMRQNVDANEVVNLRGLFVAPEGYTLFVTDYSNIEMRVAANISREPKFIDEFLTGSGDFHTLTAKAVFPEFSTTKDKAFRKTLRDLAKIINFALLYGGTEHTIFENMKKQDPSITKEKAKAMVDTYWEAVPMFADWAWRMRKVARETLTCKTPDGRIIDFRSALAANNLHEPQPGDFKNVRRYWDLRRRGEELAEQGRKEEAARVKEAVDKMWNDQELGVKNASEYKKMLGKFERVAVNAPLQGLAGDFMRRALTLIHRWAERSGVEGALLVHASVHDEIDFCIKNEFVPYILPRVTRLMKLRDMHKACDWPVPIECDCEYGKSWDVKEHFTGDDGHVTAAYTKIPGLEGYIPYIFDEETERGLLDAVVSRDIDAVNAVVAYLKDTLHPRVSDEIELKKGVMGSIIDRIAMNVDDPTEARRCFIAACQLHEYWLLDEDLKEGAEDETLQSYMDRMGIAPFPGLGVHVLSSVNVEDLPPLEVAPDPDDLEVGEAFEGEDEEETSETPVPEEVLPEAPKPQAPVQPPAPPDSPQVVSDLPEALPEPPLPPARRRVPVGRAGEPPVLRRLTKDEAQELVALMGAGPGTLTVIHEGQSIQLRNIKRETIPEQFLMMVEVDE